MAKTNTKPTANKPSLTRERAAALVGTWVIPFLDGDETIGDFLLLLRTLTFEQDATERESIYIEIESALTPFSRKACDAIDALVAKRADEWRKGAQG